MIEQQGMVVSTSAGRATVRLGAQSGCAACDAGKGCGAGIFGRLLRRDDVEVELDDPSGLRVGEAVRVGLPESLFLEWVMRLFAWPLIGGLAGAACTAAIVGRWLAAPGLVDAMTAVGGVVAAALLLLRARRRLPRSLDGLALEIIDVSGAELDCAASRHH